MDLEGIPRHVAIVMDGNGRWAEKNNKPIIVGHKNGAQVAQKIIERAAQWNIEYITLYAFSVENWQRSPDWISDFLKLLRWYLENHLETLQANQVRLKIIGNRSKFDQQTQKLFNYIEQETANNTRITANLALSYGGRDEIIRAVNKIISDSAEQKSKVIDENVMSSYLDTAGMPDPDLFIRTSGEYRISNFLLWQLAYTELMFFDTLWPDFSVEEFDQAINLFKKRERRYGTRSSQK